MGDDAYSAGRSGPATSSSEGVTLARRICLASLPVFVVGFIVGFWPLAGFVPPMAPNASAEAVAQFFRDEPRAMRLGLLVCVFSVMPMAMWGVGLAVQTMSIERGTPVLSYAQIVCVAVGAAAGVVNMTVWAVPAFRPSVSPETLRTLNDAGWMVFQFTTPPFTCWAVCVGAVILRDRSAQPLFPRWAGYASLVAGPVFALTDVSILFKSGPMAWNGAFGFYLPLATFFLWLVTVQTLMYRNSRR
jgi:hypothetical protein